MAVQSSLPFQPPIPARVEAALKNAASVTGVDFRYLVDTAARESGFRTSVKAPTSSATGLFQFIENTWLGVVKEHGADYGLEAAAKQIVKGRNGRYSVPDPAQRQEILNLRKDPEVAAVMAGVFTQNNAAHLTAKLKRQPTAGELYIAHFLGAGNGGRLVKAAEMSPKMKAVDLFPAAARANKSLFYQKGQAISVKGLYHNLVRRHHALSQERQIADVAGAGGAKVRGAAKGVDNSVIAEGWSTEINKVTHTPKHKLQVAGKADGLPLFQQRSAPLADFNTVGETGDDIEAGAGQIGIWGGEIDGAPLAAGAGVRERFSLELADRRAKQAPLLELDGSGRRRARGLFLKGGLGSLKG